MKRELPTAPVPEQRSVATAADDAAEASQLRDRLRDALLALDEAKRSVFVLYEIEQMPMAEIAATVGVPLQTAYSRLHAARRELFRVYGEAEVA